MSAGRRNLNSRNVLKTISWRVISHLLRGLSDLGLGLCRSVLLQNDTDSLKWQRVKKRMCGPNVESCATPGSKSYRLLLVRARASASCDSNRSMKTIKVTSQTRFREKSRFGSEMERVTGGFFVLKMQVRDIKHFLRSLHPNCLSLKNRVVENKSSIFQEMEILLAL